MQLSRRIGRFRLDRALIALIILSAIGLFVRAWLQDHPEYNPWSPLELSDPEGWATQRKLTALRSDPQQCRAVLGRSNVAFTRLDPAGEGQCLRQDRLRLTDAPLSPGRPEMSCAVGAGFEYWLEHGVQPAAKEIFGSELREIQHLGTYSCRRLYGRDSGPWSQHATANALDVAGFVLRDGTRISVQRDWSGGGDKAAFLRKARDAACNAFGTVLSPDYNAAHADHFHLDQQSRPWGVCR